MSEKAELRNRVEAKQKQLEARIAELKADGRSEAREKSQKLESKLHSLGENLGDGWDDLTEAAASKLNQWLESDKS